MYEWVHPFVAAGISADVADWVKATGLTLRGVEEVGAGEFEFYIAK